MGSRAPSDPHMYAFWWQWWEHWPILTHWNGFKAPPPSPMGCAFSAGEFPEELTQETIEMEDWPVIPSNTILYTRGGSPLGRAAQHGEFRTH